MIIPNFTGSLEKRMEKLNKILSGRSDIRLVGSSFGGLMGSIFTMENEAKVDKLILLAPAINMTGFSEYRGKTISVPVHVYHGKDDEVIPIKDVEQVAKNTFINLSFNRMDDDHSLHNTFTSIDWDRLLL